MELTLSLPSGRMKIWIPCYMSSRGTLAILCIATSVSVWGMDGLLSTCPFFFHISPFTAISKYMCSLASRYQLIQKRQNAKEKWAG